MVYSVAQLKAFRKTAKSQRKTFKNRLDAVQTARGNVYKMDDYAPKIRNKISSCSENLKAGINGLSSVSAKCSSITSHRERELSTQSPYDDAIWNIHQEVIRCDSEIGQLDTKIKNYERQIKEQGGTLMPWE